LHLDRWWFDQYQDEDDIEIDNERIVSFGHDFLAGYGFAAFSIKAQIRVEETSQMRRPINLPSLIG